MPRDGPLIEIVVPVHNEAASIEETLREFVDTTTAAGFNLTLRVCEDGSTDGTQEILRNLATELPLIVDSVPGRRGYSRAVLAGLKGATADVVGSIDSDGQCDPSDLISMYRALASHDAVFGYRAPRIDPASRRLMSWAFGRVFHLFFPHERRDPSCPYVLLRREHLDSILAGNPGILAQGFWWEFSARIAAAGLTTAEVPVHHRPRTAGNTRVYRPTKVPGIALHHLIGLFYLRRDLARTRR